VTGGLDDVADEDEGVESLLSLGMGWIEKFIEQKKDTPESVHPVIDTLCNSLRQLLIEVADLYEKEEASWAEDKVHMRRMVQELRDDLTLTNEEHHALSLAYLIALESRSAKARTLNRADLHMGWAKVNAGYLGAPHLTFGKGGDEADDEEKGG
jgi:hypothetical protein